MFYIRLEDDLRDSRANARITIPLIFTGS